RRGRLIGSYSAALGRRMSETDGRPRGRPPHRNTSKGALSEPGDEQNTYTHAQLIRFDNRFRRRLLHASRRGLESRESAAGLQVAPATDNVPVCILYGAPPRKPMAGSVRRYSLS